MDEPSPTMVSGSPACAASNSGRSCSRLRTPVERCSTLWSHQRAGGSGSHGACSRGALHSAIVCGSSFIGGGRDESGGALPALAAGIPLASSASRRRARFDIESDIQIK